MKTSYDLRNLILLDRKTLGPIGIATFEDPLEGMTPPVVLHIYDRDELEELRTHLGEQFVFEIKLRYPLGFERHHEDGGDAAREGPLVFRNREP